MAHPWVFLFFTFVHNDDTKQPTFHPLWWSFAGPSRTWGLLCKNVKNLSKYWLFYLNFLIIRRNGSWRHCVYVSFLLKLEIEITNNKKYSYQFFSKFLWKFQLLTILVLKLFPANNIVQYNDIQLTHVVHYPIHVIMYIIMSFIPNIFDWFCLNFVKIMQFGKKEEVAIGNSSLKSNRSLNLLAARQIHCTKFIPVL